ncbi:MAG: hypothetical protein NTY61_01675 [Candidatus Parcubacteria bacterium]|nr:hypothetical protein [Candidatus Parcubacteria bacterium]
MREIANSEAAHAARIKQDADNEAETARTAIAQQIEALTAKIAKLTEALNDKPEQLAAWLAETNAGAQFKDGEMRRAAGKERTRTAGAFDPRITRLLAQVVALETKLAEPNPDEAIVREVAEAYGVQA